MNIKGVITKAGAGLLVAVAAVSLSALPAAAAGQSSAASCTLQIVSTEGKLFYEASVSCTGGATVNSFQLWGSDGWPKKDHRLITIQGAKAEVSGKVLNEDIGARDEVYAKVTYTAGGQTKTTNSNRVDGWFGCVVNQTC
jgi:hypothetical protein